jgi:tetratricopeptide (TPR) repeat protein
VEIVQAETLRSWGQMSDAQPHFQIGIGLLDNALEIDPHYASALQARASAYLQAGEQQVWDRQDASGYLKHAIDDYQAAIEYGDQSINSLWNLGWAYYLFGDQPKSLDWTNRALEAAPVRSTGMQISASRFFGRIDENQLLQDPAESFPAGTEAVYFGFDYTGLPTGSEVEALVYFNDREDDSLTVLEKLELGANGTGYIRIVSPFINSGGLAAGRYRVDLHVEGQLLASGEFEVQ